MNFTPINSQVWQELETIEESKKVQYITSGEIIGMAKGESKPPEALFKYFSIMSL